MVTIKTIMIDGYKKSNNDDDNLLYGDADDKKKLPQVQWSRLQCARWGEEADCCSRAHAEFLNMTIIVLLLLKSLSC